MQSRLHSYFVWVVVLVVLAAAPNLLLNANPVSSKSAQVSGGSNYIIQFDESACTGPDNSAIQCICPSPFVTYCASNGINIQSGKMFVGMNLQIPDALQVPKIANCPNVKTILPLNDEIVVKHEYAVKPSKEKLGSKPDPIQRLALPVFVKNENRRILALDLDETLIASSPGPCYRSSCFFITLDSGHVVWVMRRPGVLEFLTKMAKHYTLVLFTRAIKEYADKILEHLDPAQDLFSARLYRQSSTQINQMVFTKDLLQITPNLNRILLVDNEPVNFVLNQNNGIHIQTWTGTSSESRNDRELFKLGEVLASVSKANDMRLVLVDSNFKRVSYSTQSPAQQAEVVQMGLPTFKSSAKSSNAVDDKNKKVLDQSASDSATTTPAMDRASLSNPTVVPNVEQPILLFN